MDLLQIRKECSSVDAKEQRPRRVKFVPFSPHPFFFLSHLTEPLVLCHILCFLKVGAKDLIDIGDRIFLPKSVDGKSPPIIAESQSFSSEEEMKFVQSLELYKVLRYRNWIWSLMHNVS